MVLRRCESAGEAELWADAYRSVLASLDIAAWWRVRIEPADAGALTVGVDYQPGSGWQAGSRAYFARP